MKPTRNLFVSLLSLSAISLLSSHSAHAAIRTWDGGGDGTTWSTANANAAKDNWDGGGGGTAFNDGDDVIFGGSLGLSPTTATPYTVASITFNNTAGAFTLGGNQLTLGGDVTNNDGDLQTISMDLLLSGTRTFNAASGNLAVSGVIDDGASSLGLTKTGAETLILTAANTYNGDTTIKAGTLKFDGNASVLSTNIIVGDTSSSGAILDVSSTTSDFVVTASQTISGIGAINGGASTIQVNGTIAPGDGGVGALTSTGNINLAGGSVLQIDLNSATQYDQLAVAGGVTLAGMLDVDASAYTQNNDDLFFLVVNDGSEAISGTFSGLAEGDSIFFNSKEFKVSYLGDFTGDINTNSFTGGNDFVMMAVPEPSSALLGGLGVLFLLRRRRNA